MSNTGKEKLKAIAEKFRNEINKTNSVIEEIFLEIKEKQASELIIKMGLVYLMTYLEGFNHEFFIEFLSINPPLMAKELKNKNDQKKLTLNFRDLIDELHGYDEDFTKNMAIKMYNEVFSYERMKIDMFISKFLDGFLELDFQNESKNRNIEIKVLKEYREIRNSIVHYKRIDYKEAISFEKLQKAILGYIYLAEELIYNHYYPKEQPLNI